MIKSQAYILPFKAGIISPGYLDNILRVAAACRIEHVSFSLRQEMVIHVPSSKIQDFEHGCNEQNIMAHAVKKMVPNIVSSYVAAGLSVKVELVLLLDHTYESGPCKLPVTVEETV